METQLSPHALVQYRASARKLQGCRLCYSCEYVLKKCLQLSCGDAASLLCVVMCCVSPQTRNVKPRTKEEQGQQKKVESLIHHSNVMHYSTTQQVRTAVSTAA